MKLIKMFTKSTEKPEGNMPFIAPSQWTTMYLNYIIDRLMTIHIPKSNLN